MGATDLYQAGRLGEAIQALSTSVRDDPTGVRHRTFLFELLCFAGEYDRAEKQLDVLAASSPDAQLGAWLYRSALHADRERQQLFDDGRWDRTDDPGSSQGVGGTLNGEPFETVRDADPRIGSRLEVFAAGQYTWVPFEQIVSLRIEQPKRLRDLLWTPAWVTVGSGFHGQELGEVLVPVLAPLSWRHPNDDVRLGRATEWVAYDGGDDIPLGQKLLLVDDEPVPFLDVRELVLTPPVRLQPESADAASE